MRIIAGKYRSRRIGTVPGTGTRPTSDRLRETLFNVLAAAQTLEDSVWLDLYAGSGAIGLEALSRGAGKVYFVEHGRKAIATIRKNLRALGVTADTELLECDAESGLTKLEKQNVSCDFCFLDPPWAEHDEYKEVLQQLANSPLLTENSMVIAEHDKRFDPGERFAALQRIRLLVQGDAGLSFYRKGE